MNRDQLLVMSLWAAFVLLIGVLMVLAGGDADDVGALAGFALLTLLLWGGE